MTDDPTLTPNLTAYDERSLLGCALHDPGTARELLRLVKHPDWFADARLARAWSALRRALAGVGDDPVMLPDAVARELAGDGGDAPTLDELIAIAKDVGRSASASLANCTPAPTRGAAPCRWQRLPAIARNGCCTAPDAKAPCCRSAVSWCWPAKAALRRRPLPWRWPPAWLRARTAAMDRCTADCSPAPAPRC